MMQILANPKTMAKALRADISALGLNPSHSQCLEIVSHQLGFRDWNTLSARTEDGLLLMPRNWGVTSNTNELYYRFGADPKRGGAAMLASRKGAAKMSPAEFAAFMQSVQAENYRGKRLRLRAFLASKTADSGTIWMRVDDENGNILRFDNMLKREQAGCLTGTYDWVERSIVLDIPKRAETIHYGFLLKNRGTLWAKEFRFDIVGLEQAITSSDAQFLTKPENLDFSLT